MEHKEYENGKVKVIPINQISLKVYPIDGEYILLTNEELNDFVSHKKMFDKDLKTLIDYNLRGLIND